MSGLSERMRAYQIQPVMSTNVSFAQTGRIPNTHSPQRGEPAGGRHIDEGGHAERGMVKDPLSKVVSTAKSNPLLVIGGLAAVYYVTMMK